MTAPTASAALATAPPRRQLLVLLTPDEAASIRKAVAGRRAQAVQASTDGAKPRRFHVRHLQAVSDRLESTVAKRAASVASEVDRFLERLRGELPR